MPGVRTEGDVLRRTVRHSNMREPDVTSEKDCENGKSVKRMLLLFAGVILTGVSGLLVYSLHLLRVAARDGSDEMYTR